MNKKKPNKTMNIKMANVATNRANKLNKVSIKMAPPQILIGQLFAWVS